MNTKIFPQQVLELLQAEGTFDKWRKQITDEFVKSEAEKVKNETRDYVFNSKTLANITEIINPKSAAAGSIYKDVQDEIMRSGFSDRIHSQVRRILQIDQDSTTNNNNNDNDECAFTIQLIDTVKSNIESAITKLQEPKTPKDIPPTPPLQPTAKLKTDHEIKPNSANNISDHPPKKVSTSNPINTKPQSEIKSIKKVPDPALKVTVPPKPPVLVSPTPSIPTTPATVASTATPTPPLSSAPKAPITKPIKAAQDSSSSSSDSSDSDSSSSDSDSDSSSDSSDSDSDSSSSSDSDNKSKATKKVVSDTKPSQHTPPQQTKPVIKKKTEKRKRKPKKRFDTSDNNNVRAEKKSRRGRLIKPSGWIVDDDSPSAPIAKRRKKNRHQHVSDENTMENNSESEHTSIRKKISKAS